MRRLVSCLFGGLLLAAPAMAENWQPVPGESGTYYDKDFMRKDQASGLIVLRYGAGRPGPGGASWPAAKSPILVYAVDCANDGWIDLGLDFTGSTPLPKGWRKKTPDTDIKAAVGKTGVLACDQKDSLPTVALP
ncbi:MAG: hypothetical protein ACXW3D_08840 [Caulobacteraceae bacterium]